MGLGQRLEANGDSARSNIEFVLMLSHLVVDTGYVCFEGVIVEYKYCSVMSAKFERSSDPNTVSAISFSVA